MYLLCGLTGRLGRAVTDSCCATADADLIRARCGDIEDAIRRLERFGAMSVDEFVANRESVDAACYRLLVGVEAAIALCYHISAVHLRQVPEQYAACFETLREAGIVPSELATRLKAMARFRNLLVPDLRAFAAAVVQLI
jgi:uncharacterized protein YutE (UPF0331/DUF86 family)